ncbi:MAG: hypothetical protein GY769_14830 [bacterium]|nr:hypothetical protein [bacterium]
MKIRAFGATAYVVGLTIGLVVVASYGAMEASGTPAFCGSCHVMDPYYQSWKTSSHADIACVDCHISPGITAELRKKYEALSMVTRYFTGTYGTNPWTEVDDAACLECHERRLLVGRELYGSVIFDHGPHLTELRRGKRLRCTSCHSQIVQGSHITVTGTSCILCHFKNQEPGTGTAECTLCHQTPDHTVDANGLQFDHGDVARFGMACESCHTPAAASSGGVPRERCLTCHNDPERLERYEEGDLLHQTHVTDHKVECTNCHLEIEHVAPRHMEAVRTECEACHGGGHSPQRSLYAGIGGKGVPPMPDVMYQAGVRCEGCHLQHEGGTRTAGDVACMSCHGPRYRTLFEDWKVTVRERAAAARRQLEATSRLLGKQTSTVLADARHNLELVERGSGIHNVKYSLALLQAVHRQQNEARGLIGRSELSPPWPAPPYETPCMECHAGAETRTRNVWGKSFSHTRHVMRQGLDCETCHRSHDERESTGEQHLRLNQSDCMSCHHGDDARDCMSCHSAVRDRTFAVEFGDFSHAAHVDDMEIGCSDCHGTAPRISAKADRTLCADCH